MPRHTLDDVAPGPHLDRTILDVHGDALVELPKNLLRPPLHRRFRLIAILVDVLTEIALSMQQRHADNRQLEVGRRAQSVTGQHAESAAVRRYRLLEAYLHREVGDAGGQNGRILVDGLAVTGHIWACCSEETVPLPQRAARTVLADSSFSPKEKLATQSIRKQCGDRNFLKSLALREVDRTRREKRCPSAGELVRQLRWRLVYLSHTRSGESRSRDRHALLVLPATGEAEQPGT